MRIRFKVLALAVSLLPACGGGSSPAAPPPPVTTPPTTLANFSGVYTGLMDYNVQGQGVLRVTGRTTLNHSGTAVSFTPLVVTAPGINTSYVLGSATLVGGTATGGTSYQSAGCGVVTVETVTRFGPPQINLTVELRAQSCAPSRILGELTRQ